DDTAGILAEKLADVGARLLVPTLERYLAGDLSPTPQDNSQATICSMIKKDDGHIDWSKPAAFIARMVRAYDPWPGTYTMWNGHRLLVHRAVAVSRSSVVGDHLAPGTIIQESADLNVTTGDGVLLVVELQLEGRKRLSAAEFLRGYPAFVGSVLGTESPHETV
ncbi:MAG: methionyl-tRNA formyltransferase, partial [bacterium]|nr:methionyl-tRNA formyltransferase [bacterium]